MPAAAMIFNGLHFAQAVADKALAYAKQSSAHAIAIFLKAAYEKADGYGFSSNIGSAETFTGNADADDDDTKIIESNIRLLKHEVAMQKITLRSHLLRQPAEAELKLLLQDCAIIFIQGHDEHGRETPAGVDEKKLLNDISIPLEIVA